MHDRCNHCGSHPFVICSDYECMTRRPRFKIRDVCLLTIKAVCAPFDVVPPAPVIRNFHILVMLTP